MKIILFTHPSFLSSQSMPRFANMLVDGMRARGHNIETWFPTPKFYRFPSPQVLKKWLGYVDQYLLFPAAVKRRIKKQENNTLYVFADQALGPYVPLVAHLPHVIHCHDFLAQKSASGEINENQTSWTGKKYQSFIRNGYRKGRNFISVSNKTREDLHRFLLTPPLFSKVVYNPINPLFKPGSIDCARASLSKNTGINLEAGYLLHVGGNQWYKNRPGVIMIYNSWRAVSKTKLPLIMIGSRPNEALKEQWQKSLYKEDIHLLSGLEDEAVQQAYAGATLFLFPSLAEGFGWPIAEAMASGCLVITTNEAPMTEVAGKAGFYIDRMPVEKKELASWETRAAQMVNSVVNLSPNARDLAVETGVKNVMRFNAKDALDNIESMYREILNSRQYNIT